jgi:hypothetical protein
VRWTGADNIHPTEIPGGCGEISAGARDHGLGRKGVTRLADTDVKAGGRRDLSQGVDAVDLSGGAAGAASGTGGGHRGPTYRAAAAQLRKMLDTGGLMLERPTGSP